MSTLKYKATERYAVGWNDPRGVHGTEFPRYFKRRRNGYRYEIVDTTKEGAAAIVQKGLTGAEADAWLRLLKEDN